MLLTGSLTGGWAVPAVKRRLETNGLELPRIPARLHAVSTGEEDVFMPQFDTSVRVVPKALSQSAESVSSLLSPAACAGSVTGAHMHTSLPAGLLSPGFR